MPQAFNSPGWPVLDVYQDNLNCTWVITAPPSSRIEINLANVATEFCCDSLEVSNVFYKDSWFISNAYMLKDPFTIPLP